MMSRDNSIIFSEIESSYRKLYGKLFASLFCQFGARYIDQIEDAIQNSFYKSLKSWKPGQIPDNKENWLYIVARNDLINQRKKERNTFTSAQFLSPAGEQGEVIQEDSRLQTILFFTTAEAISAQTKVIFILKNIFGLHINEISECTLMTRNAIYKSINRAKKTFQGNAEIKRSDVNKNRISGREVAIIEEVLYAVFSIGFDSFNEKIDSIVNDDLCLESLALAKLLSKKYKKISTQNLIALFCFHLARVPAKLTNNQFIPFFRQKTDKWDHDFIKLGFHYLEKPNKLNKYYLEALIASKHMTAIAFDFAYWNEIIKCYELLNTLTDSPIVKINLSYCLHKAERTAEAIEILESIEKQLPQKHFYFSLVKAAILKDNDFAGSNKIISGMLNKINQKIRKDYIAENMIL